MITTTITDSATTAAATTAASSTAATTTISTTTPERTPEPVNRNTNCGDGHSATAVASHSYTSPHTVPGKQLSSFSIVYRDYSSGEQEFDVKKRFIIMIAKMYTK